MTAMELNRPEIEAPPEPGSIGAGAEIYRRLERGGQRRSKWMMAAPIVGLAVIVAGGVLAYEAMVKPNTAPPAVQAQASLPAAAPVQVAPVKPAPAQVASATAAPAPEARVVRPDHARPVLAKVARTRTSRPAHSAAAAGEDTSAYTPAPHQSVRPAPVAATPAPAMTAPPAPVTVSPPPAAASAAPVNPQADSSQTAPAPQP